MKAYTDYSVEKALELLKIDSPTGMTAGAAKWVKAQFEAMGYKAELTNKGAVMIDLGGDDSAQCGGILLAAHTDTLGGMVAEIKSNGRLRIINIGGLKAVNVETEDVRVYGRFGGVYEGTVQLINASSHVNPKLSSTERTFDTVEVVLDENVKSREDVLALGITNGSFVCVEPRSHVTQSGYIKSRFLDDKLSVGILLGLAKYIKDNGIQLSRHVYLLVTVYEEVGHGGACPVPAGVTEEISVDMGCVGEGLICTERQVSICARDAGGPYDYELTNGLILAAQRENADYAVDVYTSYSSDVDVSVKAGNDVRHACIGPGVYASHGYERSHVAGVEATLRTLKGYLNI